MSRHSTAAQIGAAIRRHMATPDWAWRHQDSDDPIEARAIARLRTDRDRAARWLELAAEAIGMPLPRGNGLDGPWQRAIVLDRAGLVGLIDIAAGRIAWTDAWAPSYVRRFAVPVDTAQSPNLAGGTGGKGDRAVAQVAILYGMKDAARPRLGALPRPKVTEIEWGLKTCYAECGAEPSSEEWRAEWAPLVARGVSCRETTAPQWEEVPLGPGVDRDLWDRLMGDRRYARHRAGNSTIDGIRRHYVEVHGTREARQRLATELLGEWRQAVAREACRQAEYLLAQTGHPTRTASGAQASDMYGPIAVADRLRDLVDTL